MAKTSKRIAGRTPPIPPPRLKLFRPMNWYAGFTAYSVDDYIAHLLIELGRLGLTAENVESAHRAPHRQTVLSDLLAWMKEHPGNAYSQLVDWQSLDLAQMQRRLEQNREAKPRIEISAEITKMNNLTVRWHPGGWRDSAINWDYAGSQYSNLIPQRKWRQPPDFHWFRGDEEPYFDSRPSNELMFIRGVGNLRPEPVDDYGPYSKYNRDVVHSILICAARAAYEELIKQLECSFEVTVVNAFEFTTREEFDDGDPSPFRFPLRRVVAWSLEDAAALKLRRDQKAAQEQEQKDDADFAGMQTEFGVSPDQLVAAIVDASAQKRTGPAPSAENINRNSAKALRAEGFKLDAGQVRRLRFLVEKFRPDMLPEALRPASQPPAPPVQADNIVQFPKGEAD